jgi:hypothetical protein
MTAAPVTDRTVAAGPKPRRNRRWLRAVLPLGVVLALIAFTVTVHALQQPDATDTSFLSPVSNAGDGADRLAAGLTAAGMRIERQTTTPAAIAAARTGSPATVLLTTPELVYPDYLIDLRRLPSGTRIVLVAPAPGTVEDTGLGVQVGGPRWTAAAPAAGCSADFAAGPAAVLRWRYRAAEGGELSCYAGGVVELRADDITFTLVGAADAFRNDRAGEHANQAFAVGLLSGTARIVWLDLHEHEPPPPVIYGGGPTAEPDMTGLPDRGGRDGEPGDDGDDQSSNGGSGDGNGDGGNSLADSPLGQAFPPALWATILLLALAGAALAAASARRLGAPVTEPLPVRVRAAETVRGLGGLYRRARARDASLATVQGAAVRRLAGHFGLPPDSSTAEVAERVAAYTGQPVDEVRAVLGAAAGNTDRDLASAATAVQNLVRQTTQQQVINEGTAL